ncbi:MAG: cytochrome c biogenesis protein ResB [Chloroflexota bacterium]
MNPAPALATTPIGLDRLARPAERVLRLLGDPRTGLGLLLVAAGWNAAAAALPRGGTLLDSAPYLLLLGGILLSGLAAVAVRAPAAWREWRRPAPVRDGPEALTSRIALAGELGDDLRAELGLRLGRAGYRVRSVGRGDGWSLVGVRRGWSRFGALGSHAALLLLVVGAAVGAAFGSETAFSLLPGDQALLDAAHPGFTDSLRLDRFDAAFGSNGRPLRLDTAVTFLRGGQPMSSQTLRVNQPGSFGGYLVHGWTYGPAVRLHVTTLGGRVLLAGAEPLDQERDGLPAAFVGLPAAATTLGVTLVDVASNVVEVAAATPAGRQDAALLRAGEERRVGDLIVRLDGFDAYVTFLARRDPGMGLLFAGAGMLSLCLVIGFWLPRRRISLRLDAQALRLSLRGERFDRPAGELARLRGVIEAALR